MEMGGVSIFGKYCKEILGGGSDKKFPQRKYQLLLYIKNQSESKKISTAKYSTLIIKPIKKPNIKKQNQKNFHNENINIYNIYNEYNENINIYNIYNEYNEKFPQRKYQLLLYTKNQIQKTKYKKPYIKNHI